MPQTFSDQLTTAIRSKGAPVCVGIDPVYSMLPAEISEHRELNDENDSEVALDAVLEFCRRVIKIVAPMVPAVKLNSAFFERYLWEGIEGYYDIIQEASDAGLIVIGDCKRGDAGYVSEMYAQGLLGDPDFSNLDDLVGPDAITVSPYFGLDGVKPFLDVAKEQNKGVFITVRTSFEPADAIQNVKLESGITFCEHVAKQIAEWTQSDGVNGLSGYSNVGAVVATRDAALTASIREILPRSIFLTPGTGTLGIEHAHIASAFKPDGTGALVCSGRTIIYAYDNMKYVERFSGDWEQCIAQACRDTIAEVKSILTR